MIAIMSRHSIVYFQGHFLLEILFIIFSILLLLVSANSLIYGTIKLSQFLRISPIWTAVSIVALGTSIPEIVIGVSAIDKGLYDASVSVVLGSNITNILLIIGLSALIFPFKIPRKEIFRGEEFVGRKQKFVKKINPPLFLEEKRFSNFVNFNKINSFLYKIFKGKLSSIYIILITATITYSLFLFHNNLSVSAGTILLVIMGFFVFSTLNTIQIKKQKLKKAPVKDKNKILLFSKISFSIIFGSIGLYLGGEILIHSILRLAEILQIAESTMIISVVAIGSSFPELFLAFRSVAKGFSSVMLGAILGTNIINILVVGSITAWKNINVISDKVSVEYNLWMIFSTVFIGILLFVRQKFGRIEGLILCSLYIIFLTRAFV